MKTPAEMVKTAQDLCNECQQFGNTTDTNYASLKARLYRVGNTMHVFLVPGRNSQRKGGLMRVTSGHSGGTLCATHFRDAEQNSNTDQDLLRFVTCRFYCGETVLSAPPEQFKRARLPGVLQGLVDIFNPSIFATEFNEPKHAEATLSYAGLLPSKKIKLCKALARNLPDGWEPVQEGQFYVPPISAIGHLAIPLFCKGGSLRHDSNDIVGLNVRRLHEGLIVAQWCSIDEQCFQDVALKAGAYCTSLSLSSTIDSLGHDRRVLAPRQAIAAASCPDALHLEITSGSSVSKSNITMLPGPFLLYSSCATVEVTSVLQDPVFILQNQESGLQRTLTQEQMSKELQDLTEQHKSAVDQSFKTLQQKRRRDEAYALMCEAFEESKRRLIAATKEKNEAASNADQFESQAVAYEQRANVFRALGDKLA